MAWNKKTPATAGIKRQTIVVDADGKIVGRLATHIAKLLLGKDQPGYTPHIDTGVSVKVINASKLVYSGNKMNTKVLFRSSNRPSGIKRLPVAKLQADMPGEILRHAVKYMLPKNRTQSERMKRLTIEA